MCSWCHCFSRFKYTYFCPCLVIICRFFVGCITIRSSISPYSCTLCTQRTFLLPRLHLTHCCCYPNWGAPASVLFTVSFNGLFRWIIVLIWLQPVCFPVASHGFPLSWLYILRQRHDIFLVLSPPFLASDPLTNFLYQAGDSFVSGLLKSLPAGSPGRHEKLKTDCLTRRMMNEFVWYII